MEYIYLENYEKMSEHAACEIVNYIKQKPDANICLASGGSPDLTYDLFVKKLIEEKVDTSKMWITKLDEWIGVKNDSELSCEKYIYEKILKPLNIKDRYITFNSEGNPFKEVEKVRDSLAKRPIDLCVLGFGKNGHLGLNEPDAEIEPYAHVIKLSYITKTHPMIYGKQKGIEFGMSIGMKEILDAKEVILLMKGAFKKELFNRFKTEKITSEIPATYLWLHNNCKVIVDGEDYN